MPQWVRLSEWLGVADSTTKCNTHSEKVGERQYCEPSRSGKKGVHTWDIANSPKVNGTRFLGF